MKEQDNGGYLYPASVTPKGNLCRKRGITRRDWLAGLAMQGFAAADEEHQSAQEMALVSYKWADSMIAKSKEKPE